MSGQDSGPSAPAFTSSFREGFMSNGLRFPVIKPFTAQTLSEKLTKILQARGAAKS